MPVPRRFDRRLPDRDTTRVNDRIRVPEVRVIDENGNQIGVMRTHEAIEYAQTRDLDLVEVAATARPPVCRVLDYSKYKYEQAQKKKVAKKHQTQVVTREIKFRPKIADHDYATKKGHVIRFLKGKDKVKVTIMFRGREVTHPERGRDLLERLVIDLDDICQVDQRPSLEGRNMTMMLSPSKEVINGTWTPKVPPTAEEEAAEAAAEDAAGIVVGGDPDAEDSTSASASEEAPTEPAEEASEDAPAEKAEDPSTEAKDTPAEASDDASAEADEAAAEATPAATSEEAPEASEDAAEDSSAETDDAADETEDASTTADEKQDASAA